MEISELHKIFLRYQQITTDTRECRTGAIFFALKGDNFNGNLFAAQALEQGCSYAVVDEIPPATDSIANTYDSRIIKVENVLTTLQDLAAYHRRYLATPILQVTGTNGKTTTKELLAAVLSRKYNLHYTNGNLNNHIGVPKTLLQMTEKHNLAVIETGANHPGEIALLSKIVDADAGVVTNVGKAHLEGFGSFEGVIRTKSELYDYLRTKAGSFVLLRGDDEILTKCSQGLPHITYGLPGRGYDVEGEVVKCDPYLRFKWRRNGCKWHEVATFLIGAYNINNALCAIAAGIRYGVDDLEINAALESYQPTNNRSELVKTMHNTLVVDAYNANPTSMAAALDNFTLMQHNHKVAIIGEMRELGAAAAEEHAKVVAQLSTVGCQQVWLVGENFQPFAHQYKVFKNVDEVKAELAQYPITESLILIKGSNGTKLFTLPDLL